MHTKTEREEEKGEKSEERKKEREKKLRKDEKEKITRGCFHIRKKLSHKGRSVSCLSRKSLTRFI